MNSARTSNASRRSNQNIAADMNGEMRTLREKLERKKRAVENKDQEIAQIDDQIEDNKDAIAALYERAQNGGTAAPVNDRKLSEKRDKVQRLKDKIAELQAELRKEERDLKRMEGAGENLGAARIQDEILSKEEEKSSLQFIKEALAQERMAALRDVENVESEIKSLETILMLAQGDDNIG
jgi:chromosome segregation ATPase